LNSLERFNLFGYFTCLCVSFGGHGEESLLEGDVQGSDHLLLAAVLFQVVDGPPVADPVGVRGGLVVVLVVVQAAQLLHVPDDLDGVSVDQRVGRSVVDLQRKFRIFVFLYFYSGGGRVRFLTFLLQYQLSSVEARMCEMVPKRWNNMAKNWITKIRAKKNTNTKPIGSSCKYSLLT